MKRLSLLAILVSFISSSLLFAQSNVKVKTIDGKKCSLHKVQPKETWTSVSKKYNLSIDEIKSVNHGINDLKIGQIINIPETVATEKQKPVEQPEIKTEYKGSDQNKTTTPPQVFTHAVSQGETLYGIAKQYLVTVDDLKKWNNIKSNSAKIGQIIFVSDPAKSNITMSVKTKAELNVANPKKETKPVEIKTTPEPKTIAENKTPAEPKVIAEAKKTSETKKDNETGSKEVVKTPEIKTVSSPVVTAKNDSETKNPVFADAGDKIIAVSNQKTESEYKPARTGKNNKSKNGNSVVEVNESGMAAWIKDGDINQNKFYGLHRNAPLGTIIKVSNRMNDEYVFVKIVGQLPDTGDNDKQIIKISEAAAKRIGAVNEKFQVDLSYGMLQ